MNRFKKLAIVGGVMVAVLACDQVTKRLAENHLSGSVPVTLLGDTVRFQYVLNQGGFLSFGAALPAQVRFWLFVVIVSLGLLLALIYVLRSRETDRIGMLLGISLAAGGGVGNLIDRVVNGGAVIDFLNLGIGGLRTGIFNLADVAIMLGLGLIFLASLGSRPADEENSGLKLSP